MARQAGLLLAATILGVNSAIAQVITSAERTVAGLVRDSVSGRALSGAVAYFDGQREEHRSGADGRFRIENVTAGDTVLVVRRVGYVPGRVGVPRSPSAAAIDVGTVYLRPVATELDRIAVEVEEVRLYPHLSDFYRRKQEGLPGQFFTRVDIERSGVRKTSDMLRRTSKTEIDCPNDPVRSGDQCIVRNRRGRDVRMRVQTGAWSFDRCEMDVFVDGLRSALKVDEIPISWIAGIEIYASAATTPANFGRARCGVIAIWTTGARG